MAESRTGRRALVVPARARRALRSSPAVASCTVLQPRDYSQRTPKKMIAAALRGALSDRARNGRIHAVTELVSGQTPSTKSAKVFLGTLTDRKQVLVVIGRSDETGAKSVRNLPGVHILTPDQLNTYDVLRADDVVFSVEALNAYITANTQAHEGRGGFGLMATVTDPRDIILAPVISEKSYGLIDDNVYTFLVHPDSNKTQIKIAIEKIFSVKVAAVNTANRQGKRKRTRAGYGKRKSTKRAIVTLAPGSKPIDLFGAPA